MEITRMTLGIAAGVAGSLFVGYCIYFDQKRRKDPDFKRKLRERRMNTQNRPSGGSRSTAGLPDMSDHNSVQSFFLQEVQLGETLLAEGDLEGGVEHLGQAVTVCGQSQQLLSVLQQTLPAPIFHLLLQRLPAISKRLLEQVNASQPNSVEIKQLQEEDVE